LHPESSSGETLNRDVRMPAEIVLARIDNRLIHGQVLEAWVPYVDADCIVVANDMVATHPLRKKMMTASVPSSLRVIVGSVAEIATLLADAPPRGRILLLFADSGDAVRACESGIVIRELNLGNLHGGDGKRRVSCTIALDDMDLANFRKLEAAGVRIVARCIPSDEVHDWKQLRADG